jgi:hypothetical protein
MSSAELRELVASLVLAQKETDRQLKETDQKLNRLEGLFGMQFGRLTEAILSPGCLKLFQKRGIAVVESMRRLHTSREGENLEIDLLLVNATEAVVVEMKAAFKVRDVDDLVEDLEKFRKFFPKYNKHTLYGAVASFEYLEDSDRYAHRNGLFVLTSSEETVAIANPLNFKPKRF